VVRPFSSTRKNSIDVAARDGPVRVDGTVYSDVKVANWMIRGLGTGRQKMVPLNDRQRPHFRVVRVALGMGKTLMERGIGGRGETAARPHLHPISRNFHKALYGGGWRAGSHRSSTDATPCAEK
jgi:hypothetical protein